MRQFHHFGPDDPAPDHLGSHHFPADSTADTTAPAPDLRSMWSLVRW